MGRSEPGQGHRVLAPGEDDDLWPGAGLIRPPLITWAYRSLSWGLLQLPGSLWQGDWASAQLCLPGTWTYVSLEGVGAGKGLGPATLGKPRPGEKLFPLGVTQGSGVGSGLFFVLGGRGTRAWAGAQPLGQ